MGSPPIMESPKYSIYTYIYIYIYIHTYKYMARVWMCWMDWINPSFWGWLLWLFIPYKIDHQSSRGNWSDTSPGFDFTTVYLSSEGMWCRNCHRVTYWTYWTKHVFTETSCVISLGVLKKWETQPRFFLAIAMGTWSTMAFWGTQPKSGWAVSRVKGELLVRFGEMVSGWRFKFPTCSTIFGMTIPNY